MDFQMIIKPSTDKAVQIFNPENKTKISHTSARIFQLLHQKINQKVEYKELLEFAYDDYCSTLHQNKMASLYVLISTYIRPFIVCLGFELIKSHGKTLMLKSVS